MSSVLLVVLMSLATYRVTRLVTTDTIFDKPREAVRWFFEGRFLRKQPDDKRQELALSDDWHSKLAYFVGCPWCVSLWVGGLITLATMLVADVPYPPLVWPATSAVTGLLASWEGD